MAVVIVAAPDGAANSYLTLAEAEIYMEEILNASEWDTALDDTKNRALVTATLFLDPLRWKGQKVDSLTANALRWPRAYVYNQDGQLYDSASIPSLIKKATAWLAFELIKTDRVTDVGVNAQNGEKRAKVGPLEVEYFEGSNDGSYLDRIPYNIRDLIAPFLNSTSGWGSASLVRG